MEKKVSFCIPTLNNSRTLKKCLESIVQQTYKKIEIVIVDGGSTDNTLEIAKQYTTKIFFEPGKLGKARNLSLKESSGEIVALIDSDIILPHEKWLENAIKYFDLDLNVSTVWPKNIAPPNSPPTTKYYFAHWELIIENRIERQKCASGGGNSLFKREALLKIGGINEDMHWGEDFDWANKLMKNNFRVVYLSDPIIHDTMNSLQEYSKKQKVGSQCFSISGLKIMNENIIDMFREQYSLGTYGMVFGLIKGQYYWFYFPIMQFIRLYYYGLNFIKNFLRRK
jgi:glycosyltransferase involved in cell wall biosynthesis